MTGLSCQIVAMRDDDRVLAILGSGIYIELPRDWMELANAGD